MMHKYLLFAFASLHLVIGVGCGIGYNKTLFFTRTNVGIDIDSQPPTLELTIARREAVMSPTFENGKTPPVLASFAFHMKAPLDFSSRISSTFAGGDAAVTLAKLYDKSNKEAAGYQDKDFDSTLQLTKRPYYEDIFGQEDENKKLLEPGEIKPFIFATDTSFGLKVAWSGATAQAPDSIKLGYNRKEFALAPVTMSKLPPSSGEFKYEVKMPSFLATVDNSTELKAVSDSKMEHLQYFATGIAADALARHHGVRKAMHQRLDPVSAEHSQGFILDTTSLPPRVITSMLHTVYIGLKNLAIKDTIAQTHVLNLNKVPNALQLPASYDFTIYVYDSNRRVLVADSRNQQIGNLNDFQAVITYRSQIQSSIDEIETVFKLNPNNHFNIIKKTGSGTMGSPTLSTDIDERELQNNKTTLIDKLSKLDKNLMTQQDVVSGYHYFLSKVNPK